MRTANTERSSNSSAGLKAGGSCYEYQMCHWVFLYKTTISPGLYRCFAFADRLTSIGSVWLCLAPSEFGRQKGRKGHLWKDFCPALDYFTLFYPLPKPFPCATIGEVHSLSLLCSFACSWREAHACWSLQIDWGGQGVVLPCRYYRRTTDDAWLEPRQPESPSKSVIGKSECVTKVNFIS